MDPDQLGDDWTPSMQADLDKRQQSAGAVDDALHNDDITPDQHQELMGQIMPRMNQLKQAKQNAMQQALQQQKSIAMDQHAFQTSMDLESRKARIKDAQEQVGFSVNPHDLDGDTQAYTVDHRGDLVPFDHGGKKDTGEDSQGAIPYSALGAAAAGLLPGASPGENGTSPNSHTMDINIGGQQSRATFNQGAGGWQQTGQQHFNPTTGNWEDMAVGSAMGGTPAAPAATGMHGELSEGELRGIGAQAQLFARAQGFRQGTREYNDAVRATAGHLMTSLQSRKAQDAEHRRQEAAKATGAGAKDEAKTAEAAKKEEHQMRLDYGKQYADAEKEVRAEKTDWQKADIAAKKAKATAIGEEAQKNAQDLQDAADAMKQPYFDAKGHSKEVVGRAQQRMRDIHGWDDSHFKKIGVDTGEKKPAPSGGGGGGGGRGGGKYAFAVPGQTEEGAPAPQPAPTPTQPSAQPAPQQAPGVGQFVVQQGGEQPVRSILSEAAEGAGRALESAGESGQESVARTGGGIINKAEGYARGTYLNARDKAVRAWRRLVGYTPEKK